MKKAKLIVTITISVILSLLALSSCSNSDDNNTVNQAILSGNWKVSYYFDNTDETSDFVAYTFTFNNGGTVSAMSSAGTVTGTWSESGNRFNLSFGADPVLSELNDDWLIEEKTASVIKLKDDNPAQDDRLHFQKL